MSKAQGELSPRPKLQYVLQCFYSHGLPNSVGQVLLDSSGQFCIFWHISCPEVLDIKLSYMPRGYSAILLMHK